MRNYRRRKNKTVLYVCLALLLVIVTVLATVCALLFAGVIDKKGGEETKPQVAQTSAEEEKAPAKEEEKELPSQPTDEVSEPMYIANVEHAVYFRSAPSEDSGNIITTIPVRTRVTFLKNETSVFAKIEHNGQTGYVKREYLSADYPQNPANYGNTAVSGYKYVVNVENAIYLRSTASETSSNVITTIPLGSRVGFIEKTNSTFSKIQYDGKIGYAKNKYLADYQYTDFVGRMEVCNVKHSIYLRSSASENSSNIITTIPVGEVVNYIDSGNGTFYKISWGGYTGYAKSSYLRFI